MRLCPVCGFWVPVCEGVCGGAVVVEVVVGGVDCGGFAVCGLVWVWFSLLMVELGAFVEIRAVCGFAEWGGLRVVWADEGCWVWGVVGNCLLVIGCWGEILISVVWVGSSMVAVISMSSFLSKSSLMSL